MKPEKIFLKPGGYYKLYGPANSSIDRCEAAIRFHEIFLAAIRYKEEKSAEPQNILLAEPNDEHVDTFPANEEHAKRIREWNKMMYGTDE